MGLFDKRITIQPYEYPELLNYMKAVHASFWIPEHFTYDRDILEYKTQLSDSEREVVKRCMLAIGMVENSVKTFWSRLDLRMPKPEISSVGISFGNTEVIHMHTQQKLLELMGLEKAFEELPNIPCMEGRRKYLSKYLKGVGEASNKEFTKSLILFTLLVENASLFSQFLILSSYKKYQNVLSNYSAVIGAIAREEDLHANFGIALINILRKEYPEWFDSEMESKVRRNIQKAFKAEVEVLDWIFENGELSFMPKRNIVEYLKHRFNNSLVMMGYEPEFEVDQELLEITEFLDVQIKATSSFDFFNEKSTDYSNAQAIDENDIWD